MSNNPWTYSEVKLRELLKHLREKKRLSQTNLANSLNKPQSFVSKYESGERKLSYLEVKDVLAQLGISVADFDKLLEENFGP